MFVNIIRVSTGIYEGFFCPLSRRSIYFNAIDDALVQSHLTCLLGMIDLSESNEACSLMTEISLLKLAWDDRECNEGDVKKQIASIEFSGLIVLEVCYPHSKPCFLFFDKRIFQMGNLLVRL